jgi:hypothetical protein
MAATRARTSVQLIVSEDARPKIEVKPGMNLQVVSTVLVGPDLKKIKNIGARLCGGGGTCMALIDIGSDVVNPPAKAARAKRGGR